MTTSPDQNYTSWYVGMKVVCIETEDDPEPPNPVYGEIYTISWIGVGVDGPAVLIDLLELPNPENEEFDRGYLASAFRRVQTRKTDISVFTAMLSPKPAKAGKVRA